MMEYMCPISDYKIEMPRSAFRSLMQFEQAHLHMTDGQRIGNTDCFPTVLLMPMQETSVNM